MHSTSATQHAERLPDPRGSFAAFLATEGWTEQLSKLERRWLAVYQREHSKRLSDFWEQDFVKEHLGGPVHVHEQSFGRYGHSASAARHPSIAGGWRAGVASRVDDNGWDSGFCAHLEGVRAFLEAMGLEPIPGAEDDLGPFLDSGPGYVDLLNAYETLVDRMVAALTIVSRAALTANPGAEAIVAQQKDAFDQLPF
jgi:hypothetical protein